MSIWLCELEVLKSIALHFKLETRLKNQSVFGICLFALLECDRSHRLNLSIRCALAASASVLHRTISQARTSPRSIGEFDGTTPNGIQAMPSTLNYRRTDIFVDTTL